jgi:hypothetical protein
VAFHHVGADPRTALAASDRLADDQLAELDKRPARMDAASRYGPWSAATMTAIAENPGAGAGDLAEELGRKRDPFATDVRKLKNLGLPLSLEVGYKLSPRGAASRRARGGQPG